MTMLEQLRAAVEAQMGFQGDTADQKVGSVVAAMVPASILATVAPALAHVFDGPGEVSNALEALAVATEVSLDLETTALSPWVAPHKPAETAKMGDGLTVGRYRETHATSFNAKSRARVLSFAIDNQPRKFVFDLDLLSPEQALMLVGGLDGKVWVGHNLRFDYMWLRVLNPTVRPGRIVDAMLIASHLTPHLRPVLEDWLCGGGLYTRTPGVTHWTLPARSADVREHVQEALLSKKRAESGGSDASAATGVSLDLLSAALLGEPLAKSHQKPHNWMPAHLTADHHAYCMGDITQPPKIARLLLGLRKDASHAQLMRALESHPGYQAYNVITGALTPLVGMQFKGLNFNRDQAEVYRVRKLGEAAQAWAKLEAIDRRFGEDIEVVNRPSKDGYPSKKRTVNLRDQFLQRGGTPAPLVDLLVDVLRAHAPGVTVPQTAEGKPAIGAKPLLAAFGHTSAAPVVEAFNAARKAVKAAHAAVQYVASTDAEGRLHADVSPSAITGRTRSQNPNVQNPPADPEFRALFTAPPGTVLIASDYSAVEMRIAAALAARAYAWFRGLIHDAKSAPKAYEAQVDGLGTARWLLGLPGCPDRDTGGRPLIDQLADLCATMEVPDDAPAETTRPDPRASSPADWAAHYRGELFMAVRRMLGAGAFAADPLEDALAMRDAFAAHLDIHSVTAAAMLAQAGELDLGADGPLEYLRKLSRTEREAFKTTHKLMRQKGKAVGFGLLYGMQVAKLHVYGVETYRLTWTLQEAEAAREAFLCLYPEITLWHIITTMWHSKALELEAWENAPILGEDEPGADGAASHDGVRASTSREWGRKLFQASTLSNKPIASTNRSAALNYQDQGTGAEIAMDVLIRLQHVCLPNGTPTADCLVNFVHDEFILEAPAKFADHARAALGRAMREAHDAMLLRWGVPCELESAVGDHWIH